MTELLDKVEPIRVRVNLGTTKNLGDFESLRIDIALEDSARSGEKAADTLDRIYSFVEKKLIDKVQDVFNDMKDMK